MKTCSKGVRALGISSILLLFAAAPTWGLPQDKAAEEAFRKIEETLEKAKSFSVKFQSVAQRRDGEKGEAKGVLQSKQGNRLRMEIKSSPASPAGDVLVVSDGQKLRFASLGPTSEQPAPKDLTARLAVSFARAGPLFLVAAMLGNPDDPDPRRMYKISEFKTGADEGGRKTLSYKLSLGQGMEVRLWYDPKTWLLSKRVLSASGEMGFENVETYEEYVVNGDIPDDRFSTAPVVAAKDKAAEEAFQKIRESIENAKTIKLKFKGEDSAFGMKYLSSGSFLLKEGNRVRLEMKASLGNEEAECLISSNGKKLSSTSRGSSDLRLPNAAPERDTPENLGLLLKSALVHTTLGLKEALSERGRVPKKPEVVSDLRMGQDDRGSKTLWYKLSGEPAGLFMSVCVWFDPKTYKVSKRTLLHSSAHAAINFTETFEEYILNEDLSDELFKLLPGGAENAAAPDALPQIGNYPPPPAGMARLRAGIFAFSDKSGAGAADPAGEQLETLAVVSKRFNLVDRLALKRLIKEQNLEETADPAELAKTGKLRGVDAVFVGAVTSFRLMTAKKGVVAGLLPGGPVQIDTSKTVLTTDIGVEIRLIRATTGEILSKQVGELKREIAAGAWGVRVLGIGGDPKNNVQVDRDSQAKLLRYALDEALRKMLPEIDGKPGVAASGEAAKCSKCGSPFELNSKFCGKCGAKRE